MADKLPLYPSGELTVVIRDSAPVIFEESCPTYRTVKIQLTDEQLAALALRWVGSSGQSQYHESIAMIIMEPKDSDNG